MRKVRWTVRHSYTKPYTPQTKGKAERFLQTSLRERAYAHRCQNPEQRAVQAMPWLHHCNWH